MSTALTLGNCFNGLSCFSIGSIPLSPQDSGNSWHQRSFSNSRCSLPMNWRHSSRWQQHLRSMPRSWAETGTLRQPIPQSKTGSQPAGGTKPSVRDCAALPTRTHHAPCFITACGRRPIPIPAPGARTRSPSLPRRGRFAWSQAQIHPFLATAALTWGYPTQNPEISLMFH